MAKKKTKENPEVPARITKEYRTKKPGSLWGKEGEVWCTVKVVEGVLPSGTRYITENIFPDHTPEEEKKWEAPKVYQISILNFHYKESDNEEMTWYTLQSDSGKKLTDRQNVICIDLAKIREKLGSPVEELSHV